MPKKLEKTFQEEVRSRQRKGKNTRIRNNFFIFCFMIGFAYLLYQFSLSPSGQPRFSDIDTAIDEQRKKDLTPVPLPKSSIQKPDSVSDNNVGTLRFFLRKPVPQDDSSLSNSCANTEQINRDGNNKYHYFVELIDWVSGKVVTTAFVRSGEMLVIPVPFGAYRLRYAVGTQWYGEKELFGSRDIYEMTNPSSPEAVKFEFSEQYPGRDLGAFCSNGNLGSKRIQREI
jgi:hypothetical protein